MDYMNTGFLLNKAAKLIRIEYRHKVEQFGLTPQQSDLLRDIHANTGAGESQLMAAAISDRLMLDRPTISGMLDRLEKSSWITRRTSMLDRRRQTISLTPKAKKLIPQLDEAMEQSIAKALNGMSERDVVQLGWFMLRISDNLDAGEHPAADPKLKTKAGAGQATSIDEQRINNV